MPQTPSAKPNAPRFPAPRRSAAPTIARRKTCDPRGTGLSHYVLMDKKAAK